MPSLSPVLLPEAQKIFPILEELPPPLFYLAGGTGLALQLKHRISIDFDFFSEHLKLDFEDREKVKDYFRQKQVSLSVEKDKERTLIIFLEGVRISFFYYPYLLVKPLVSFQKLLLASPVDIGIMKLSAIINRGARKDFIDLYEIIQQIPIKLLMEEAAKKYPDSLDFPFQAAKALNYFEDAEQEPIPRLLKPISWEKIRSHFEQLSREMTDELLK
jgi:hypothetical protein